MGHTACSTENRLLFQQLSFCETWVVRKFSNKVFWLETFVGINIEDFHDTWTTVQKISDVLPFYDTGIYAVLYISPLTPLRDLCKEERDRPGLRTGLPVSILEALSLQFSWPY